MHDRCGHASRKFTRARTETSEILPNKDEGTNSYQVAARWRAGGGMVKMAARGRGVLAAYCRTQGAWRRSMPVPVEEYGVGVGGSPEKGERTCLVLAKKALVGGKDDGGKGGRSRAFCATNTFTCSGEPRNGTENFRSGDLRETVWGLAVSKNKLCSMFGQREAFSSSGPVCVDSGKTSTGQVQKQKTV